MQHSKIVELLTTAVNKIDPQALVLWGTEVDFAQSQKTPATAVLVYPFRDTKTSRLVTTSVTVRVLKLDTTNNTQIARKELGDACRDLAMNIFETMNDIEPSLEDRIEGNNNFMQIRGYTNYTFTCYFVSANHVC